MKSVKKSVTLANLNTGNAQEIDLKITDEQGIDKVPMELVIVNDTGCDLGIVYIANATEKALYTSTPAYFDFIPIDSGRLSSILPASIRYIYVKKLSGTASADLDLYCLNYVYLAV